MAPLSGLGEAPKKFLRRNRRKGVFGARRNTVLGGFCFMRKLKFFLAAALILCAVCLIAHGVEWVNDTPVNPDGPINVPLDGARYIHGGRHGLL